jgi:hypothetical protein
MRCGACSKIAVKLALKLAVKLATVYVGGFHRVSQEEEVSNLRQSVQDNFYCLLRSLL